MKKKLIIAIIAILAVIGIAGSVYTVREDQYACVVRFSKIENTVSSPVCISKSPSSTASSTSPRPPCSMTSPPRRCSPATSRT